MDRVPEAGDAAAGLSATGAVPAAAGAGPSATAVDGVTGAHMAMAAFAAAAAAVGNAGGGGNTNGAVGIGAEDGAPPRVRERERARASNFLGYDSGKGKTPHACTRAAGLILQHTWGVVRSLQHTWVLVGSGTTPPIHVNT